MDSDLLSVKTLVRESKRLKRFSSRTPDDLSAEAHMALDDASMSLRVAANDLLAAVIKRNQEYQHQLADAIIHYLM